MTNQAAQLLGYLGTELHSAAVAAESGPVKSIHLTQLFVAIAMRRLAERLENGVVGMQDTGLIVPSKPNETR